MKYPSADSLNSAASNSYTFDQIIEMEGYVLKVIDWQLLQYPVFEFINLFLSHGCLFEGDMILQKEGTESVPISHSATFNVRRYAEFFTDFTIQES